MIDLSTNKIISMPDIFDLIGRWWKQMTAMVLLSLLAVGIIVFLKPRQYLSVATAVAASTYSSDKGKIFNDNIQGLYSALGSPDDLDMIVNTGGLDTPYLAVAEQFNLYDHYKMDKTDEYLLNKAATRLKSNTKVMKNEYGALQVKVWDTDKNLAPQLANAILDKLAGIHQQLLSAGNETTLKGLQDGNKKLQASLDSGANFSAGQKAAIAGRIAEYDKLIGQYQLMVDSKPPVLITVEKAKTAIRPDKPRRVQIMIATALFSTLFALLAALVLERRKYLRL
jgi:hypothetical protein